jgi:flavodoxin
MKIAKAMAAALDAQLLEPNDAEIGSLQQYDLLGFGSGIVFGTHDPELLEFVDKLPKATAKKALIFSTRGRNSLFQNSYHRLLRSKLTEKGYTVIGEFSCRGFTDYYKIFRIFGGVNKGHPTSKEIENAKTFALDLAADFGK